LINTGTLAWDDATLYDGANSVISNASGATINIAANGSATSGYFNGGAGATFYNAGQINVVSDAVSIDDNFVNTGAVSIEAGSLILQGGGTNEGVINASSNATLNLSANTATFTCTSGSLLTNQGNILFGGYGTINLEGTVSVAGTNYFGADSGFPKVNITGTYPITTPLVISGGTISFLGTGALTPPTVLMVAGTLTNEAALTTGELTWTGGTIEGVVEFNGGSISGEQVILQGGELINTGSLAWSVFNLVDEDSSVISNAPGGTINVSVNSTYGTQGGTLSLNNDSTFYNAGTLNISASKVQFTIEDTFFNTGTVSLNSGVLVFRGGGTNYGALSAEAGATLEFSGNGLNVFTCVSGSIINSAGNLWFESGTINLAGTVAVGGSNIFGSSEPVVNVVGDYPITTPLVISNGTANFSGAGALTPSALIMIGGTLSNTVPIVTGQFNWTGGHIEGVVQFNVGTIGSANPDENMVLEGGELINTGTLTWDYGIADGNGSVISNAPGAIINMGTIPKYSEYGAVGGTYDASYDGITQQPATFYNAGQLNISPGTNSVTSGGATNTVTIDDTFINTGNVYVNPGTVNLANGGTNYGTITVAPAATLQLSLYPIYTGPYSTVSTYPVFTFNAGSKLNDAGNLLFGGPTLPYLLSYGGGYGFGAYVVNIAGTVSVGGSNIFGLGETYPTIVNLTGAYSTTNPLIFSGQVVASFGGAGLAPLPSLRMSGGTLSNSVPLVVNGPLTWSGGTIAGPVRFNGGTISNTVYLSGGQLVNAGVLAWENATLYDGSGSTIVNSPGATINLTTQGSLITFLPFGGVATFNNAGQLNISASSTPAGIGDTFNNTGTVSFNSGTVSFSAVYAQTAGLTLLNGGSINNTLPLQIQGGTLGGSGTISGSVTNNSVLSPGSPLGQMAIGGSYYQTPAGTLDIDLAGTTPVTGYSLLTVTGGAALAGTLNVALTNGYFPASTNALYTFLQGKPVTGTFGSFDYPSSRLGMEVSYGANSSSVQVTSLSPVAQLKLTAQTYANGQFTLEISAATSPFYIEASTNLLQWDVLMTNLSPGAPYVFTDFTASNVSARYYRALEAP